MKKNIIFIVPLLFSLYSENLIAQESAPNTSQSSSAPEKIEDKKGEISTFPLLGIYYGMSICLCLPPCIFFSPLAQGLVAFGFGEPLFKTKYPKWWIGSIAGYATYAVGLLLTSGAIVGLTVYTNGLQFDRDKKPFEYTTAGLAIAIPVITVLGIAPFLTWIFATGDAEAAK